MLIKSLDRFYNFERVFLNLLFSHNKRPLGSISHQSTNCHNSDQINFIVSTKNYLDILVEYLNNKARLLFPLLRRFFLYLFLCKISSQTPGCVKNCDEDFKRFFTIYFYVNVQPHL